MTSAGAALAALRRTTWHRCAVCRKRFAGITKAVYCSNACRQKAKYRRKVAALNGRTDSLQPPGEKR